MCRSFFLALTLIAALLGAASEAPAQSAAGVKARGSSRAPAPAAPAAAPMSEAALGERMNANTVSVVSGTPGGTYFRMASDMAFVLDDGVDVDRPMLARSLARMQEHVLDDRIGALAVLHHLFKIALQHPSELIDLFARSGIERGVLEHFVQFVDQFRRKG